ncbi:response regulator [Arthrobacter sunyaminii]|uniref:Transcriptional regulatory protein n=1 Tax=Arthrobacter sunyaminii TaxID=2816859 RepID=A0A975XLE7_9MICC|nr:response regulator [Arthrobacter sunyaminii]MBO0907902.1 response regulator [Arthrobacter sunyaminii]QWQ36954.1 response regulator [Arthrobacter sunyaminii]
MIRVLIIDDDFMVAKVHAGFVQQAEGFQAVGVAHTGAAALNEVVRLRPDLVLLDIHLPDINGLDLLQRLRDVAPELDVLVISAARETDMVRRALRGGIVHYLMKPFTGADLRERLEHYRLTYQPLVSGMRNVTQTDMDQVFGSGRPLKVPLPKGCSAETLRLVEAALTDANGDLSSTETADMLGMSRVSTRRYLEYLAEIGSVEVNLRYGPGRPERRYLLRTLSTR